MGCLKCWKLGHLKKSLLFCSMFFSHAFLSRKGGDNLDSQNWLEKEELGQPLCFSGKSVFPVNVPSNLSGLLYFYRWTWSFWTPFIGQLITNPMNDSLMFDSQFDMGCNQQQSDTEADVTWCNQRSWFLWLSKTSQYPKHIDFTSNSHCDLPVAGFNWLVIPIHWHEWDPWMGPMENSCCWW